MGQHKHNPTAIKAKNREIPPNPPKTSKRELKKWFYEMVSCCLYYPFGKRINLDANRFQYMQNRRDAE